MKWSANSHIFGNVLEAIGRTPLVRLRLAGLPAEPEILAKLEYLNPSGSVKDRIYYYMIQAALEREELKPRMTLLESSSGNAGIACAMVGALLGFPVVIVMPSEMSQERKKMLRAFGAEILETPGGESDIDLSVKKVEELLETSPGRYWVPSQFTNPDNIAAHLRTTGPEIWEQTEGRVAVFVAGQGSGGTLTGVGRYLREANPQVKLYAVEPAEAATLAKGKWGTHKIEGIGDGFIPRNLDVSLLDGVVLVDSGEAIATAQRLAREAGIFCGISAGANVAAALKIAPRHPEADPIVTIIPDSGMRYFSTELCGEERRLEIPERTHTLDDHTNEQLARYQAGWEIIE